jgi:hypothetical protein
VTYAPEVSAAAKAEPVAAAAAAEEEVRALPTLPTLPTLHNGADQSPKHHCVA